MNLRELFQSEVVTAQPSESVAAAVKKMQDNNIGAVVVVEGREVVGILTDRDVALKVVNGPATADSPVSDIMSQPVITIWDDQGVYNATQYFLGHKIRRLPVIDREGNLVGMVALDDLLMFLARELVNVAQAVQPALATKSF